MDFDVIIIGGGPGGYVAGIRASRLGLKAAVIEKEKLGGICLNWGCIPTKALLNAAHSYRHIKHQAGNFGINAGKVSFDIKKIIEYSRKKSQKLSDGINYLMKKNKITVYEGVAFINLDKSVTISGKEKITGKNIIVATGASPITLPGMEFDNELIWNYRHAMVPVKVPKSIIIVGSGAIGIEFADFYNSLGTEITVVEVQPQILPAEDDEIVKIARAELEKSGIKIYTDSKISSVQKTNNQIELKINDRLIAAERIIVAAGVSGNSSGLGLEKFAKIKIEKSYIKTDDYYHTGEEGIYAIGDVSGPPCLAHKASHEGILCVEKIAGRDGLKPIDKSNIPGCTYCYPQIASVGLTEKQAKESGYEMKIGRFTPSGNGKSVVMEENVGLVKTIFDKKTGELLGAHMAGAEVTEMIQGYTIGKTLEATDRDFRHTIFPHPTLSEMMHESVLDADDESIHS
ncbi:MAG: dihydrolipoyl dehydrogenase [Rickettsiaceae bacterium H1]|nr:dihydrolipoyl dehydrogenase [Rickettsiaceae bacterium H1]